LIISICLTGLMFLLAGHRGLSTAIGAASWGATHDSGGGGSSDGVGGGGGSCGAGGGGGGRRGLRWRWSRR
jgi:hypothetical protein